MLFRSALEIAKKNALKLNIDSQIKFINASWFDDDFFAHFDSKFDVIVSNPPYIPSKDISNLDEEVKCFDPMLALDGGIDGMDSYKKIAEVSYKLLNDEGLIFLEGGINQAQEIANIFINSGFKLQDIIKDYAGVDRCIFLKKTNCN